MIFSGSLLQSFLFVAFPVLTASVTCTFQKADGDSRTIKIGLLVADNKSLSALHGAELAVRKANRKGGYNGTPFRMVTRSMEGPWGTGSKQAVNLIFDEEVVAILGSHDGRNAHLVEQVSTKSRIVMLSAWASDPTLSQAFVPWYFTCVPNDNQQSLSLIDEVYNVKKISKVATVSGNDYDSEMAVKCYLKNAKAAGKNDVVQFSFNNSTNDFSGLLDQIRKSDVNAIILFGPPSASSAIIRQLRLKKMIQPVFCSLAVLGEKEITNPDLIKDEVNVYSFPVIYPDSSGIRFRNEYQKSYGKLPDIVAAYAYDGMNLLIDAIRSGGTERENLQKAISNIHFTGVTGLIEFDARGNRKGVSHLKEIKKENTGSVEK
jgi:branched-chain amino acid transport system substrate-binding protein